MVMLISFYWDTSVKAGKLQVRFQIICLEFIIIIIIIIIAIDLFSWWQCMFPNTLLRTQISVSLVPYKLKVSYYSSLLLLYALWNEVPSHNFRTV